MVLKYTDRPQLNYGGGPRLSASPGLSAANANANADPMARFPQGSQPIASAPTQSATPIIVYEANGRAYWALSHNNGWQALSPHKDHKSGAISWRMNGTRIPHPVAWSMPRQRG